MMRLRLTVHRQSLPITQILWTAGGLRSGQPTCGESLTISQLLEQVNEVIPLEAEDWGLEDYLVEVQGYECLHFSRLDRILKDEDEVTIRPLQTIDLRYRKISGRHQISSDGRHLIDGVAFGRPFLRQADRPIISILPRKRLKLTPNDGQGERCAINPIYNDREIVLRKSSQHGDESLEDSATDENSVLNADGVKIPPSELMDITNDVDQSIQPPNAERSFYVNGVASGSERAMRSRLRRQRQQQGLGLNGEEILELVDENGRPYPGEYQNPLLERYYQDWPASSEMEGLGISRNQNGRLHTQRIRKPRQATRRSSSTSLKSLHFQEDPSRTPATVLEVDDTEDTDDEDFSPDRGTEDSSSESNKENVKPNRPSLEDSQVSHHSSTTSSDTDSVSSETSSSSDLYSTSSSDSDLSQDVVVNVSQQPSLEVKSSDSTTEIPEREETKIHQNPTTVPPGNGKIETQKRNKRRRNQRKLQHLKKVPRDTKLEQVKRTTGDSGTLEHLKSSVSVVFSQSPASTATSALEAKRKALLESIASSGVEVGLEAARASVVELATSNSSENASIVTPNTKIPSPTLKYHDLNTTSEHGSPVDAAPGPASFKLTADISQASDTPDVPQSQEIVETPASELDSAPALEPVKRRAKLDLASSRRLLFGSLGHRAPKTKLDEDNLRQKLMKNIKPMLRPKDEFQGATVSDAERIDTDDDWKDKIILRAVECCHVGIELSTPPFPFVQRWDSQQQGSHKKKISGRGKKRKRRQESFLEEDLANQDDYEDSIEYQEPSHWDDELDNAQPSQQDLSRTTSDEYQVAIDEQIMQDTNTTPVDGVHEVPQIDDLPSPPADLSKIPNLHLDTATVGATIAFKQLEMSEATNWQPQVSEYRTAIIDKVLEDGKFEMTLAQRDRPKKYKVYDDETGERVYSRFEVPQDDDEDTESNSGFVELALEEMIEPKLLEAVLSETPLQFNQNLERSMDAYDLSNAQGPVAVSGIVENPKGLENTVVFKSPQSNSTRCSPQISGTPVAICPQREREPLEVTEDSRREISMLIKDAGFRSDVHSEIDRGLDQDNDLFIHGNDSRDSIPANLAPSSNALSSSSPGDQDENLELDVDDPSNDYAHLPESDDFELPETQFSRETYSTEEYGGQPKKMDFYPTSDEDNNNFRFDSSPHPVKSSPKVSVLLNRSVSPPIVAQTSITIGNAGTVHVKSDLDMLGGAQSDSSDDFPSVEKIFSTQDSISVSRNEGGKLKQEPQSSLPPENRFLDSQPKSRPQTQSQQYSKARSLVVAGASSTKSDYEGSDIETVSAPNMSQIPFGSQIVDLTISSDAVNPGDSELEEKSLERLPSGPGWVNKIKSGRRSKAKGLGRAKQVTGRKTQSM